MSTIAEIKDELKAGMNGAVDKLVKEYTGLRAGRARAEMLDPVEVDSYGSKMPLKQVANVSTDGARNILVMVWDKSLVGPVEKGIRDAGLGLNPMAEGQTIRVPVPQLSEERRKELAKVAGKYAEDTRISIRNHRRHGMDAVKKLEKDKEITEDEAARYSKDVQTITDDFIAKVDDMLANKEKEILTV